MGGSDCGGGNGVGINGLGISLGLDKSRVARRAGSFIAMKLVKLRSIAATSGSISGAHVLGTSDGFCTIGGC